MWSVDCHALFAFQLSLLLPSGPKHHGCSFHNSFSLNPGPFESQRWNLVAEGQDFSTATEQMPVPRCRGCVWLSPGVRQLAMLRESLPARTRGEAEDIKPRHVNVVIAAFLSCLQHCMLLCQFHSD